MKICLIFGDIFSMVVISEKSFELFLRSSSLLTSVFCLLIRLSAFFKLSISILLVFLKIASKGSFSYKPTLDLLESDNL